jgi:hypothetical protein
MTRIKPDKQKKNNPNIPLVDLVYYFAIHKENESKKKSIRIEIIPPRAWRVSLKARRVLFSLRAAAC